MREVTARRDAGNAESHAPRVRERNALSAAAGALQLCGESQGGGREAYCRCGRAGPRQADSLRGRAGVVGDRQCAAPRTRRRRLEGHAEGATGVGRHGRTAVIGLSKVAAVRPGNGHVCDVKRGVARIQ